MDTIFMNSKNSKTFDPDIQLLNLTDEVDLRKLAFTIYGKILKSLKSLITIIKNNNTFKISAPTWN